MNASVDPYTTGLQVVIGVHMSKSVGTFRIKLINLIICHIVSCCTTNPLWIAHRCSQQYSCICPLCCSSWFTKAITSFKSECCFLLNSPSSRQCLFKVWLLSIIWWFYANKMSISLLVNPTEKYIFLRWSMPGIMYGKGLSCDAKIPVMTKKQKNLKWLKYIN